MEDLLAQYEPLKQYAKIYIPSTVNVDESTNNGAYVTYMLEEFSRMFGGATCHDGRGAWMSEKGLVIEDVTFVYSYCQELTRETTNKLVQLARWLKNEMSQEAITLEINGDMRFID